MIKHFLTYILIGLVVALITISILYKNQTKKLIETRENLAEAIQVNKLNSETIIKLEESISNTNQVTFKWVERTEILDSFKYKMDEVFKEATQDEKFKYWADNNVPSSAWRMLKQSTKYYTDQNSSISATSSSASRLSDNENTRKR